MLFTEINTLPCKEIIKGFTARSIHTGAMSFVYWTVKAGAEMPVHSHLHQQVAQVLKGAFNLTVNEQTIMLKPGMVAVIPSYAPHGGKAITDCELLDVFNPEREDYKF